MERSGPSQGAKPRKELNWWHTFNSWWRDEYDKLGRRPRMQEVDDWYHDNAERIWGAEKPSLEATRDHAKCMRSKKELREYFQRYNAKKQFGRPFTDLRQMRGSRQRSGSHQHVSQSPGSVSDPGGGGDAAAADAGCDASSGGGGDTPMAYQTASTPPPSGLTDSPLCTDAADRPRDRDRDSSLGGGFSDGGMPIILATVLTGFSDGDALGTGRSQGTTSPSGRTAAAPPQPGGRGGGGGGVSSRPGRQQPNHLTHLTNDAGVGPGSTDTVSNANNTATTTGFGGGGGVAAGGGSGGRQAAAAAVATHNSHQPQHSGGAAAGGEAAPVTASCSMVPVLHTTRSGPHRVGSNLRPPMASVVASPRSRSQSQSLLAHNTSVSGGAGGGTPGGTVGGTEEEEAEGGPTAPPDPYLGNKALVTRWLADLASTALGHRTSREPEGGLPEPGLEDGAAMACEDDAGGGGGAVAARAATADVEDGRGLERGALLEAAARRAAERVLRPAAKAAATAAAVRPPLRPMLLLREGSGALDNFDRVGEAPGRCGGRGQKGVAAGAARAPPLGPDACGGAAGTAGCTGAATGAASPELGDGGGYDADDDGGDAGQSTTSHHHHQRQHQHRGHHQHNRHVRSELAAEPAGPRPQLPRGNSARTGGGGAHVASDGDAPDSPRLGHKELSLSALLAQPALAQAGSLGAAAAAAAAALPHGVPSSGGDELPPAGPSVGAKRSAASLGLMRTPSLRAPGSEGELPDTPSLHRAPKLLRLEQVQQVAGRLSLSQRLSMASSGATTGLTSGGQGHAPTHSGGGGGGAGGGGAGGAAAVTSAGGAAPVPGGLVAGAGGAPLLGLPPDPFHAPAPPLDPFRTPAPPPDPFRTPILALQRSVGSQGILGLGGGGGVGGLAAAAPLLSARESVSTHGGAPPQALAPRESVSTRGMPPPPPLPLRESVGTANVPPLLGGRESLLSPPPLAGRDSLVQQPPLLMGRDSLQTRLMPPPPPLPPRESVGTANAPPLLTGRDSLLLQSALPERSSVVRSLPSNLTSQHQSLAHPHELPLLRQHQGPEQREKEQEQQQEQPEREEQQQQQQEEEHPQGATQADIAVGHGATVAAATLQQMEQAPLTTAGAAKPVSVMGVGEGTRDDIVAATGALGPQDAEAASTEAAAAAAAGGVGMVAAPPELHVAAAADAAGGEVATGATLSVPIVLQSRGVERVRLRQSLEDGRTLEAPVQVITIQLTLPASALDTLRSAAAAAVPMLPPPMLPPS